ncbi:hypothetical protein HZB93_00805 [Candidatus Falkowbacteria bacterium]|nr:hypothetical protein [Candidatus Falkowbacteria bacterium]
MKKVMALFAVFMIGCNNTFIDLTPCYDVYAEVLPELPMYDDQLPILGLRITNDTCDTVYVKYILTELRRLDDDSAFSICSVFDCSTFRAYQDGRLAVESAPPGGGSCLLEIHVNWTGTGDGLPFGEISSRGSAEFVYTAMIRPDAPSGRYQYILTGYWIDEFEVVMSCNVEDQPVPSKLGVPILGPVITVL